MDNLNLKELQIVMESCDESYMYTYFASNICPHLFTFHQVIKLSIVLDIPHFSTFSTNYRNFKNLWELGI